MTPAPLDFKTRVDQETREFMFNFTRAGMAVYSLLNLTNLILAAVMVTQRISPFQAYDRSSNRDGVTTEREMTKLERTYALSTALVALSIVCCATVLSWQTVPEPWVLKALWAPFGHVGVIVFGVMSVYREELTIVAGIVAGTVVVALANLDMYRRMMQSQLANVREAAAGIPDGRCGGV